MNEKQKASAVLDYLEEQDSEVVINILQSYISDENLAALYDKMKEEGISVDCTDDDDDTPEDVENALDYVREQLGEDELRVYKAQVSRNMNLRMPANMNLDDGKILDLLEEYGEDNDLPEGWWEEYGEMEDWLMKL